MTQDKRDEIDVIALLRVIWIARYWIILLTVLTAAYSVYLALTTTPRYKAQNTVLPVSAEQSGGRSSLVSQFGGLAGLAGVDLGGGGKEQDYLAILHSRALVETFIQEKNLLSTISDGDEQMSIWFAVKKFREEVLSIVENDDTGVVVVVMDWKDPHVAAEWANEFIKTANEIIKTKAKDGAQSNIDFLNGELAKTSVADLRNVLYNLVENETKTLMLANARNEYAFSVVDEAVAPEIRSTPKRRLMVTTWTAGGFVLSLFLTFLYHLFKRVTASEMASN